MHSAHWEASGSTSSDHVRQLKLTLLVSHCAAHTAGVIIISAPPQHLSSLSVSVLTPVQGADVPSANTHRAFCECDVGSQWAKSRGQKCVRDDRGITVREERGWQQLVCIRWVSMWVFLHIIADTIFNCTSPDYTKVRAACTNETVV